MAPKSRLVSIKCRCGKTLKKKLAELDAKRPLVIFCEGCYLNHRLEWMGRRPVVTLQYYFPDD